MSTSSAGDDDPTRRRPPSESSGSRPEAEPDPNPNPNPEVAPNEPDIEAETGKVDESGRRPYRTTQFDPELATQPEPETDADDVEIASLPEIMSGLATPEDPEPVDEPPKPAGPSATWGSFIEPGATAGTPWPVEPPSQARPRPLPETEGFGPSQTQRGDLVGEGTQPTAVQPPTVHPGQTATTDIPPRPDSTNTSQSGDFEAWADTNAPSRPVRALDPIPEHDDRHPPFAPAPQNTGAGMPTFIEPGRTLFDRYMVLRMLGKGGMGQVWLVRHINLDVLRALKVIHHVAAHSPEARRRFQREAIAQARINHPNVVNVNDANFAEDDLAYIEMEYVEGYSLDQLIQDRQPMDLPWVARFVEQLCEGLQAAHNQGIIHRDLKPPNLMILSGRQSEVALKILDFGIAKLLDDEQMAKTRTGQFVGTLLYAAPEQIETDGVEIDHRVDIYATGIILYELLTGRLPFEGSPMQLMQKHVHEDPPPFDEVNPDHNATPVIEELVLRCLAKDPRDRIPSAMVLKQRFLTEAREVASRLLEEDDGREKPQTRDIPTYLIPQTQIDTFHQNQLIDTVPDHPKPKPKPKPNTGTSPNLATILSLAVALVALAIVAILVIYQLGGFGQTGSPGLVQQSDPDPNPTEAASEATEEPLTLRPLLVERGYVIDPTGDPNGDDPPEVLVRRLGDRPIEFVRVPGSRGEPIAFGIFQIDEETSRVRPGPADHEAPVVELYWQRDEVSFGELFAYFEQVDRSPDPQTDGLWQRFWNEWNRELGDRFDADNLDRLPATGVSRRLAEEFADYYGGRLPTPDEWEYAARSGGERRRFVWGLEPTMVTIPAGTSRDQIICNIGSPDGLLLLVGQTTFPQGWLDRTDHGLINMAGNVRELTAATCEETEGGCDSGAVVCGSSYNEYFDQYHTSLRRCLCVAPYASGSDIRDVGFRIVLEDPFTPSSTSEPSRIAETE